MVPSLRLVPTAVAVCLCIAPRSSSAQDIGDAASGLALARQVCAECHAVDKQQARSPDPASPRFEAIANVPGMTSIALTAALLTSHRSMPNLILDSQQRRNVVTYILSLK